MLETYPTSQPFLSVCRQINDEIAVTATRCGLDSNAPLRFLCECEDLDCEAGIELPLLEFQALRAMQIPVLHGL